MANRVNINFSTIFKRSSCLNAVSESVQNNSSRVFEILKKQIESVKEDGCKISPSFKNSLRSFIESLCNRESANNHYREPLFLIEALNEIDRASADYVLTEYTNRILPYVEDLSMFEETLARYEMSVGQRMMISECANKYILADRILNNHNKISKRFNITLEIQKARGRNLRSIVEACCCMIDTYTITPYAKFNLCLEEMCYVMDKESINYDKRDLVKFVTEYFLLRGPELSSKDIRGYQTVLNENCYISNDDNEYVSYVLNPDENNSNHQVSITKEINKFLMLPNKTAQSVEDLLHRILSHTTPLDITTNISKVFWLIWNLYKNDFFDDEIFNKEIFPVWSNLVIRRLEENDFTKKDILDIQKSVDSIKDLLVFGSEDDYEYLVKISKYKNCLDSIIAKIEELAFLNYSENNVNAIAYVNKECENPVAMSEFKMFKFRHLVKEASSFDKFLDYKSKNIYENTLSGDKKIIKKIKDISFTESLSDIYQFIGEDAKTDICVAQYYINESHIVEIQELFEGICKEYNDRLICENLDSIRCYYIINPGVAEVHIKESVSIIREDIDWEKVSSSYNSDFDLYVEQFAMAQTCLEQLESVVYTDNIKSILSEFTENDGYTLEHYKTAMEALSLLDVDYETVNAFSEDFKNYIANTSIISESVHRETNMIQNTLKKWKKEENTPIEYQVEAFELLLEILNTNSKVAKNKPKPVANNKKNASGSENEKSVDKTTSDNSNPFKGINLNSINLYLQGLKTKMKDMSSKEKEISRNLDNSFRVFVKNMKNALVSDRREAIIKGSVIPSFSRCIKIAISLAGVGLVTGNPVVPLIIAIGGFAVSKRLTYKERVLLLDEIETELDVVEKEISMAESKNQMKKYRTLLKYKKDLQRQYQRIKYNIRVGKDILPGSAEGVPNRDN